MKLISAKRFKDAERIAGEHKLKQGEWVYIPWKPADVRNMKLRGVTARPEDLIGYFSYEEKSYLTERVNNRNKSGRHRPIPANRVMKLSKFDDVVFHRLARARDADELEYNKEFNNILSFYGTVNIVDTRKDVSWFKRLILRIKKAYNLLVHGFIEYEDAIVINGSDSLYMLL